MGAIGSVVCDRCGQRNGPMQLFCERCGARLNMETALRGSGWRQRLSKGGRIGSLLLAAGLLGLAFWPAAPRGEVGAGSEMWRFAESWEALGRAGSEGRPYSVSIAESHVNSYLAARLTSENLPALKAFDGAADIDAVNMLFTDGAVAVFIRLSCGPVFWTTEFRCVPRVTNAGVFFDVAEVKIGHLPLPGPLGQWWTERLIAPAFRQMNKERSVLEYIRFIRLTSSGVRLSTVDITQEGD